MSGGHPATAAVGCGPSVVAWELTRQCPLACAHCRGGARNTAYAGELTTAECLRVVATLAAQGRPLLILTGGEPLCRPDVWEIAGSATAAGLRVVMAPCGASVNDVSVARMLAAGVKAISLSLDGATAESHDAFRGVPGAFATVMEAMACARRAGLPFQVNTTVSRLNHADLPAIRTLARDAGASQLDLFFLVPVGRGAALRDLALDPAAAEAALEWAVRANAEGPLRVKTTCAPQIVRVRRRLGVEGGDAGRAGGCMAGRGFVFISHTGILQPCGFCDVPAGDLRAHGLDFAAAYAASAVFAQLRAVDGYGGKCGVCEYRRVCGGCRARALAACGDYLAEEPSCPHQPAGSPARGAARGAEGRP